MSAARRCIIGCSRRRALTRSTSFPRAANCSRSPGGTPRISGTSFARRRETGTSAAWTNALETAESLDDIDYKLRALWGLWVDCLNNGAFQEALTLARRFYSTAASSADPIDPLMGDRMIGIALHFMGEQPDARRHIERMLGRYVTPNQASHIIRFQFDQRVTAHAFQ